MNPENELNKRFGEGVRAARVASNMTQDAIADAMQERGFSFHQATIYKIENGHRKTPITEALALADILGHSVEELAAGGSRIAASPLDEANRRLTKASAQISAATREQTEALLEIAIAADTHSDDLNQRDLRWLQRGLRDWTPAWMGAEGYLYLDAYIVRENVPTGEWVSSLLDMFHADFVQLQESRVDG